MLEYGTYVRSSVKAIFVSLLCVGAVIAGVKLFDRTLASNNLARLPGHDLELAERNARTLELFPYSGWHMQANTASGNFRLGPKGFAIDFDLDNPPGKTADEFRIILIGGSGAQGWGASSTETTMARVLEDKLNAREDGRRYRVINMAMGSSVTYQNFIALNRWGHALEPDLVLSYSGINDYTVPIHSENFLDAFYQFHRLNGLAIAARGSEFPPQLEWLRDFLPNIMMRTTLGFGIKYGLYPRYFEERARQSYLASVGGLPSDAGAFMDEVVVPQYIHALSSIKRDFETIPVMVVLQAAHPSEFDSHLEAGLNANFYDRMYRQTVAALDGPGWAFANFHAYNMSNPHPAIAVHPVDEGQVILADFILDRMEQFLGASPQ